MRYAALTKTLHQAVDPPTSLQAEPGSSFQTARHPALGGSHTCFKPTAALGNTLQFSSDLSAGGQVAQLAQGWPVREGKLCQRFLETFSSHQRKPHKEDETPLPALDAVMSGYNIQISTTMISSPQGQKSRFRGQFSGKTVGFTFLDDIMKSRYHPGAAVLWIS